MFCILTVKQADFFCFFRGLCYICGHFVDNLMMIEKRKSRQSLFYRSVRTYLYYLHDCFLYKKIHRIGKRNIPADGTPVLLVSNHQNCLCDPLLVLMAIRDRMINVFVRADVFKIHPLITKIFHKLAMNPAYRLDFDGKEQIWKNRDMFKNVETKLLDGGMVMMYPEGRHQNKHWLGDLSHGYTKLAFETAELGQFQKEIWILPCCHHYSSYRDIQQEVVIKFGKPVSIKPYYELYQDKPRTAQRQVNELVREQLLRLMLHIPDLDNYKAIDFIRNTYGYHYAKKNGFWESYLPEKLQADKMLVEDLQYAKDEDAEFVQAIYEDALTYERELKKLKVRDRQFDKTPGWFPAGMSLIALVALFPLWVFSLWPNILVYKLPELAMRRVRDKMFFNSFLLGISAVITMPLLYSLSFVLAWIFVNVWVALIYAIALPWLGLFAYYYWRFAVRTWQDIRFLCVAKTKAGRMVRDLRKNLFERLNKIG